VPRHTKDRGEKIGKRIVLKNYQRNHKEYYLGKPSEHMLKEIKETL
jgi:hypothetical protein